MIHTAVQPTMRHVHRSFGIMVITWVWGTFVESHYDIRANTALNLHDAFWCEKVHTPVNMRLEFNPLFFDFSVR